MVRVERVVADADGDGVVALDLPSRIPYRSVFAVVDYGTGAYRVATPPGFPILPLVDKEPIVANNGQLKRIVLNRPAAQMLLVRPGVGVWGQVLGDGTGSAEQAVSVAGTDSPNVSKFEAGDVLVLVDPNWVSIYAARVGEKP